MVHAEVPNILLTPLSTRIIRTGMWPQNGDFTSCVISQLIIISGYDILLVSL